MSKVVFVFGVLSAVFEKPFRTPNVLTEFFVKSVWVLNFSLICYSKFNALKSVGLHKVSQSVGLETAIRGSLIDVLTCIRYPNRLGLKRTTF